MAYSVSLTDLRTACLEQADESGYGYIGTTQLDRLINRSWARLYARLVQLAEDDYTLAHTFTTTAGREMYLLPSSLKIRSVEVYPGGFGGGGDQTFTPGVDPEYDAAYGTGDQRFVRARRFDLRERPRLSGAWSLDSEVWYRTVGPAQIRFMPPPGAAHGVLIWYVPSAPFLAATPGPGQVDQIDVRSGWDDWIVYDVCAKLALKQEADAATPLALRDDVWREEIAPVIGSQDDGDPEHVLDVEAEPGIWDVW